MRFGLILDPRSIKCRLSVLRNARTKSVKHFLSAAETPGFVLQDVDHCSKGLWTNDSVDLKLALQSLKSFDRFSF